MAKITKMVDDLDNTVTAEMTLQFGLDGQDYEIDLGDENYEKYRAMLEYLSSYGRKVERPVAIKRSAVARKNPITSGGTAHIREFLRSIGHEVSDRGRIPGHLMKLWESREVVTESTKRVEDQKMVTAAQVQHIVDGLPDEDEKAEAEVIKRVKETPRPSTRGKRAPKTAPEAKFSGLREALSHEEGK